MSSFTVPLSHLVPNKRNPRRVKPDRDAHRRLVALIKAHGLLHPLTVRPLEGKRGHFMVVTGDRRLAALRDIHRGNGDPKIPCILRKVDTDTADAMSLGENVGREPMHPLDEAEAFAKLARRDGKDATAIAAEFGETERYVRQRIKLATLAEPIKTAYRAGEIETSICEAFTSVPPERQLEVWKEVDGHPHHAQHVRNVIAHDWIDAKLALFDVSTLPPAKVSQDLFSEKVLVERQAFLETQGQAVVAEQKKLVDDGWSDVVIGRREDVQDRLMSMDAVEPAFDAETMKRLAKIDVKLRAIEKHARKVKDDSRLQALDSQYAALEEEQREIVEFAPVRFSEATKSKATVFLMLDPDGRVHREYRRQRPKASAGSSRRSHGSNGDDAGSSSSEAPTSDDLSDRQLAVTFTHQAICVREALLKNALARKRLLVLALHEKVRSEALAIRHEANGTTLHATPGDEFKSAARDRVVATRKKLDPFAKQQVVEDVKAYTALNELSEKKLDAVIDVLVVELVTAHLQRPTELIAHLAGELKVNVRDDWMPDADWLSGFQKIQLGHLMTELKGAVHAPAAERKKSELVEQLSKLFADAKSDKLEDKGLAEKLNLWLPANLRELS